jgi:hypothetical protein
VITAWRNILSQLKHVVPIFIIVPPRWGSYPGISIVEFWTVPCCSWWYSPS